MGAIFRKKGKKGQHIWKFGQKYTKFENILKKDRWLRNIITRTKLLEKALWRDNIFFFYKNLLELSASNGLENPFGNWFRFIATFDLNLHNSSFIW